MRSRRRIECAPEPKQNDVFEQLAELGYTLLGKVICREEETFTLCYLKMQNKYGQKVFVYLDGCRPYLSSMEGEEMYDRQEGIDVPGFLKSRALTCSGIDVHGVSFECQPGIICMLRIDGSDSSCVKEETFFHFDGAKKCTVDMLNKKGALLSYPVVTLSAILAKPDDVLNNTYKVTKRLREENYNCAMQALGTLQKAIERLCCAFNAFNVKKDEFAQKMNVSLSRLEQFNVGYIQLERSAATCGEISEKHKQVICAIAKEYDLLEEFIRNIKIVAAECEHVDGAAERIEKMTASCEKSTESILL
jgi:hypothetical protein